MTHFLQMLADALLHADVFVDAQVGVYPPRPVEPGGLVNNVITGVQYDIVNQAKAERRLHHVEAKLRRHAEHGWSDAAAHDARRIHYLRNRIAVDEWLIRWNSLQCAGPYPAPPCIDPMSLAVMAQVRGLPLVP